MKKEILTPIIVAAAADGAFDEATEFEIAIDVSLPAGEYRLRFFDTDAQSQKQGYWIFSKKYIP